MGCWYSWEHSGFASLSPRFEPGTVHQIGEREALVTSGDCKSSTLRYMGFESLILHQIWLHSIMVSIAACHAVDRSSILLEAAKLFGNSVMVTPQTLTLLF